MPQTTFGGNHLLQTLNQCEKILIAGAGGGFDIYSGLPLYHYLKSRGKKVVLANLTFTDLSGLPDFHPGPYYLTHKGTKIPVPGFYYPEKYLSEFLFSRGMGESIYTLPGSGPAATTEAYRAICKKEKPDAIVLIDGGTDSLVFGDEESLGTIEEDLSSLIGVFRSPAKHKFLVCTAFGVDHFHGISHFRFLENTATISKAGGFYGSFSLLPSDEEFHFFKDAVTYLNQRMPERKSIVANSLLASAEGKFGDAFITERTGDSELWMNPLMSMFWVFDLKTVVKHFLFYEDVKSLPSMDALAMGLTQLRSKLSSLRMSKGFPLK